MTIDYNFFGYGVGLVLMGFISGVTIAAVISTIRSI